MSSVYEKYYHIFQTNGTIAQVEYAFNALASCPQIISVTNGTEVVFVHKKVPKAKLQEEEVEFIYKISDNICIGITGEHGDVLFIVNKAIEMISELDYKYGLCVGPNIFVKEFASKMQNYIQTSDKRLKIFSMHVFGIIKPYKKDEYVKLYYTDLSAIEQEMYACASGEDTSKMTSYLEKTFDRRADVNNLVINATQALLESIGREAEHTEIGIYVFSSNGLEKLSPERIEKCLQDISEL
ncbi:Proteasome [Ecytonucleospora hepatopenaei]|uniref:Proteasome n=1 Tax=Ecytonucleospora hepatopenaei TaxID=646526 RepID=A0A1W0E5S9_9MICR|nr:Proteasome [Ecytonucleospora hepatopenaei]